ncbi:metallophosphoesterase [Vibrio sp. 10N.286.49.B3]|uniref:metallophosphoesterase n=1 Tax=Vibrio sp. 10N.286.49.B3 TaxID=1880855 RepID=UPI001F532DE9|nr:metallophosphoesterase [Vibrio sp. 10N.286.49.B3]
MLIAHLTDLHIKKGGKQAYRCVDTLDCLRKAVSHINNLKPRPDYLVITGDLGDFGTPDEYQVIKQELLNVQLPILAVPGNHDERNNLREGLKDIVECNHPDFCNVVVNHQGQLLIGLDSSVIGKPYGYLSEETLSWLETTLQQNLDKPALLFIHHPPMHVGLNHMDVQKPSKR